MALDLPDPSAAGPAYAAVRGRICELVATSGDVADRTVPLTPEWTVRDLIAHLQGTVEDVLAGNLEGAGSDAWTAAQVARHQEEAIDELLAQWNEQAPLLEANTSLVPAPQAAQLVFDAVTHEHDLRHALGRPGARDSESVRVAITYPVHMFGVGVRRGFLPALSFVIDGELLDLVADERVESPPGEPTTLTATAFEFLRAFGGRRSEAQIAALDWEGDPAPFIAALSLSPVSPHAVDVDE